MFISNLKEQQLVNVAFFQHQTHALCCSARMYIINVLPAGWKFHTSTQGPTEVWWHAHFLKIYQTTFCSFICCTRCFDKDGVCYWLDSFTLFSTVNDVRVLNRHTMIERPHVYCTHLLHLCRRQVFVSLKWHKCFWYCLNMNCFPWLLLPLHRKLEAFYWMKLFLTCT